MPLNSISLTPYISRHSLPSTTLTLPINQTKTRHSILLNSQKLSESPQHLSLIKPVINHNRCCNQKPDYITHPPTKPIHNSHSLIIPLPKPSSNTPLSALTALSLLNFLHSHTPHISKPNYNLHISRIH